jgi:hypothetical protein
MELEKISEKIDDLEHRLINFEKEYHDDVEDAFAVLDHIAIMVDKIYSETKRINIL